MNDKLHKWIVIKTKHLVELRNDFKGIDDEYVEICKGQLSLLDELEHYLKYGDLK